MTARAGDTLTHPAAHKQRVRQTVRARRAALNERQRRLAERRMVAKALRTPALRSARDLGVYLNTPREARTGQLIRALHRRGQRVWVPVTNARHQLCWVRYRPGTPLRRASLGITEPRIRRPLLTYQRLQWVIVPLVAVDATLNRLGAGGGYYDRLPQRPHGRPRWLGWAFAAQCCGALPREPWDRPLHHLITERRPQWPTG